MRDSLYVKNANTYGSAKLDFFPAESNPHVLNPDKGFVVSCNNRIAFSSAFAGIGSTALGTARALRATKVLHGWIADKQSITIKMIQDMQKDVFDEFARILTPQLLRIVEKHTELISVTKEKAVLGHMVATLKEWKGDMVGNDKHALIYNVWIREIYARLLHTQFPEEQERLSVISSASFDHFFGSMVRHWANERELDSDVCDASHQSGSRCAATVVSALLAAHEYIESHIGKNEVLLLIRKTQ